MARTRALALAVVVLVAPLLAGCTDSQTDDGQDGPSQDIPDAILQLHEACADKRANMSRQADRPVCNPANPVAEMNTSKGQIRIELFTDAAPITAGNYRNLTEDGFYDGLRFHRVIDGFVIQDGDPTTSDPDKEAQWGTGGPGYTIRDEFPCRDGTVVHQHAGPYNQPADECDDHGGYLLTHDGPGVLSMANSGPDSAGSQYFITLSGTRTSHLDGRHAVFGQVIGGMDVVLSIGSVPTDNNDRPREDVLIHDVEIAST